MAQNKPQQAPNETPAAAEFGQLVSTLASKLGVTGQDLRAIIAQTKTRRENADELRKWLKTRPKAKKQTTANQVEKINE